MLGTDMATITCTKCGTEMDDTARFCRRCGAPSTLLEASTQVLDSRGEAGSPTTQLRRDLTGPAYVAPSSLPPVPAAPTKGLEPNRSNRRVILVLSGLVGILAIALIAVLIAFSERSSGPAEMDHPEPMVIHPHGDPPMPPKPPPPPPPPSTRAGMMQRDWIYPGSKVVMHIVRDDGSVIQLHSTDSTDKVVEWYRARFNPEEIAAIPGNNVVLKSRDFTAVITDVGNGTNIMVKEGAEDHP